MSVPNFRVFKIQAKITRIKPEVEKTYGVWLLMPLMKRAILLRLSGQITSVFEGSEAERSVIMLSPSSFSLFFKKSTSPTYSVIMVKSLMDLSASTVKLPKEKFKNLSIFLL